MQFERLVTQEGSSEWDKVVAQTAADTNMSDVWHLCVSLTTLMAVEWLMRIVDLIERYPWKLAWLLYRPPDTYCEHRKSIAADLVASLAGKPAHIAKNPDDNVAWKVATIFAPELKVGYTI